MVGYYKLSERHTAKGLFELWESEKYGDEVPSIVTLNGIEFSATFDTLDEFLQLFLFEA